MQERHRQRIVVAYVLKSLNVRVPDRLLAEKMLEAEAVVDLHLPSDTLVQTTSTLNTKNTRD